MHLQRGGRAGGRGARSMCRGSLCGEGGGEGGWEAGGRGHAPRHASPPPPGSSIPYVLALPAAAAGGACAGPLVAVLAVWRNAQWCSFGRPAYGPLVGCSFLSRPHHPRAGRHKLQSATVLCAGAWSMSHIALPSPPPPPRAPRGAGRSRRMAHVPHVPLTTHAPWHHGSSRPP